MKEVCTIGLDIAKHVFQVHGADGYGKVVISKKVSRAKLLTFFASLNPCLAALEVCGDAHHRAGELTRMGFDVRLIPPTYVKPFVKREKSDATDTEAICEAVQRPSMRFVAIKSVAQQANALVICARDLLVRQRTQIINALRGHLMEFGWVAPKGRQHLGDLSSLIRDPASDFPEEAVPVLELMLASLDALGSQIAELDKEVARRAREDEVARRLMTIPGIGPVTAVALEALAPPFESFARSRNFAAWLGLTPRQHSTGGKQRMDSITKMEDRTLRRLLIIGRWAVIRQSRYPGAPNNPWLERMLSRKPPMLVAVALANKMARIVWAVMMRKEDCRAPIAAL